MTEERYHPRAMEANQSRWTACAGWMFALLALLVAQGWMTLGLFGPDPWHHLLDDQPILSGRHPLHLYHGFLGARSLFEHGTLCCYDPAFQAGYPKTPVFDGGSRPAELFLALAGGRFSPRAYKIGLAVCCCAVPLLIVLAAWGVGLGPVSAFLAGALGIVVCWGEPCRALLEAGDLDLILTGLAALVLVGLLVRFDRAPGPLIWLGLLASSTLGWFAQPLLFAVLLVPLLLVYYITAGVRHPLGWHIALAAGLASGVALNGFWLPSWARFWWVLTPPPGGEPLLPQYTWQSLWDAPLWGEPIDRALAVGVLSVGLIGLAIANQCKGRLSARLLGLACVGLLALALAGLTWEPMVRVGSARLLVPALWFAVLPAVYAAAALFRLLTRCLHGTWRAAGVVTAALLTAGALTYPQLALLAERCHGAAPLEIGLGPERLELIDTLQSLTSADGRLLWEDEPGSEHDSHWTALLPVLTGRPFVGGLDPDAQLESAHAGLTGEDLCGRPVATWSDAELDDFCRRYNLGWVVCWSPTVVERFRAWSEAEATACLTIAGQSGCLFTVHRPLSFVLKGQARWLTADRQRITLGDVVPDGDEVVLSLHYQTGMVVTPQRVRLEPQPDTEVPYPLPFVRLKLAGPMTRVTLAWPNP